MIRITDSPDAPLPLQMRVGVNHDVRIYLNAGAYKKEHDKWAGTGVQEPGGLVVLAKRQKSCTATLAIACEAAAPLVDTPNIMLGSTEPGKPLTFYIAPGSS